MIHTQQTARLATTEMLNWLEAHRNGSFPSTALEFQESFNLSLEDAATIIEGWSLGKLFKCASSFACTNTVTREGDYCPSCDRREQAEAEAAVELMDHYAGQL